MLADETNLSGADVERRNLLRARGAVDVRLLVVSRKHPVPLRTDEVPVEGNEGIAHKEDVNRVGFRQLRLRHRNGGDIYRLVCDLVVETIPYKDSHRLRTRRRGEIRQRRIRIVFQTVVTVCTVNLEVVRRLHPGGDGIFEQKHPLPDNRAERIEIDAAVIAVDFLVYVGYRWQYPAHRVVYPNGHPSTPVHNDIHIRIGGIAVFVQLVSEIPVGEHKHLRKSPISITLDDDRVLCPRRAYHNRIAGVQRDGSGDDVSVYRSKREVSADSLPRLRDGIALVPEQGLADGVLVFDGKTAAVIIAERDVTSALYCDRCGILRGCGMRVHIERRVGRTTRIGQGYGRERAAGVNHREDGVVRKIDGSGVAVIEIPGV